MCRPVVFSGWVVLVASVGLAVGLTACGSSQPTPDLPRLDNQSAQYHGPERNPVIVIPGLLGSELVQEETECIVWGSPGQCRQPEQRRVRSPHQPADGVR